MAKKIKKSAKKKPAKNPSSKLRTAKKAAKKVAKKKPAKKAAKKKATKKKTPAKKKVVKKVAKKATKKVVAKKAVAKKVATPLKKVEVNKPIGKVIIPLSSKPLPVVKGKKKAVVQEVDENGKQAKKPVEYEPIFEYKPVMRAKPLGSSPKPFIGKDTRTKYADEELQEFKGIILKKLEEAQRDYELLKSTLSHKDDHGTDDTSPTFKLLEDGSDVMSKEETAQLAARQEKFIQALQNALIRIENKTYGICRTTGKLIPKERLRSVPHATLSIDAKLEQY